MNRDVKVLVEPPDYANVDNIFRFFCFFTSYIIVHQYQQVMEIAFMCFKMSGEYNLITFQDEQYLP